VNETNGVAEFRWIEAGSGIPVLCLHGLFGTSEHWAATVEALAPRCRAMALTLPIFETPPDDLSVMGLRAHVEAFMNAEHVPPAIVVGNSLGGHVALDLALHAAARVRG
jgi:pimeloyl-ACP methyl ester carboxylesterase